MLCQECKKEQTCKSLCKQAEKYVNQDYVPQREHLPEEPITYSAPFPNLATKSTEENIISMFFKGGIKQAEVAKSLNVSHQYVSKIVKKHRQIIRENLQKRVASYHR